MQTRLIKNERVKEFINWLEDMVIDKHIKECDGLDNDPDPDWNLCYIARLRCRQMYGPKQIIVAHFNECNVVVELYKVGLTISFFIDGSHETLSISDVFDSDKFSSIIDWSKSGSDLSMIGTRANVTFNEGLILFMDLFANGKSELDANNNQQHCYANKL